MDADSSEPRVDLRTVMEVATSLGVCRSKVYQLMDDGELPYVKLGKCRRIPWEAVVALIGRNLHRG